MWEQISKPNSIAPTGYKTKNWTLETHLEEHRAVRSYGTMSSLGEGDGFNDKLVWARNQKVDCDNYTHFLYPG